MQTVAEARAIVDGARTESELQAALTELASALYEADAEESVRVAEESIALAEKLGDALAAAWARHNRGWALNSLGRLEDALADQLSALGTFELHLNERGIAHTLLAIGDIHGEAGDTSTALEYFDRAAEPMARIGDELGQGVILNLTGIALSHELRHQEAADLFTRAEQIFDLLGDPVRVLTTKINRGFELVEMSLKDPNSSHLVDEAEKLALDVIDVGIAGGEDGRSTLAYGHSLLSRVRAVEGNLEQALEHGQIAEGFARDGGFDQLAIEVALDRLDWMIRVGDLKSAVDLMARTVIAAESHSNRRNLARATQLQADLLQALGDNSGALAAFREFHRLDRELHSQEAERRFRLTMARFQVENAQRETQRAQTRVAELEALDHDKRDFLASVSHELRTPLTAVMGFATELAEAWENFDEVEARGVVQLIARQSADISNIVDDLLTITRLEAGTMSVRPQALDVVDQVGTLVETLARDGGRAISWTGNARVWADPTRLRQIIRNLITNALRYGGDVVRVLVAENGQVASIQVRDSGGPIPASRVETMFNPFEHWDDGGRTPNSVGLGLAVARSLARMMDGDLVYDYENGESIFRLTLTSPPAVAVT
jgi:signal transduction histidine kinase